MLTREIIEKREDRELATYAIYSRNSKGRVYPENECEYRTVFNRDRTRIIHSEAFRRLEYKTQVFVNHEGDYYRTRLTHTLEVAQMARGIARTLGLNEDLSEAIALCHDLGHTPFGHSGESVLNNLMKDAGGFEHNIQSLRVVTMIEQQYPNFPGLNLSFEVLDGIQKHEKTSSLEASLTDIADEIAYMNHDIDDGLESNMLTFEQMNEVTLWSELIEPINKNHPNASKKIIKYQVIRHLIHLLLKDVKQETIKQIEKHNIKSHAEVLNSKIKLVKFSKKIEPKVKELKKFLFHNLYRHYRVERMAEKAKRIIEDLFYTYNNSPQILPTSIQKRIQSQDNMKRVICDYIAGMTDRFALNEHKKLFDPNENV